MIFELPQFALELLVLLPCVQLLCGRMRVLAMPSVAGALPPGLAGTGPQGIQRDFVPNVLAGCWEKRPEQNKFWQRIR